MNESEKHVDRYLAHQGYLDVKFEPDGKVTPDFLVNRCIAIEVRILNQRTTTSKKSIDEVAIPLSHGVEKLVASLGASSGAESWYLFYDFELPLQSWKKLRQKLKAVLTSFMADPARFPTSFAIGDRFKIELYRATTSHPTFFVMGGYTDDSGGWLLSIMEENLKLCIDEKSAKVARVRSKYAEWWLVLVDHIGHGLGLHDQKMLKEKISISHNWDKVIVLAPNDHTRAFEI